MKRYEIFSYFVAILLVGSFARAQEPADVFVTLPMKTQESPLTSLTSVEVGPCRWSVFGHRIKNPKGKDNDGYEIGLRCADNESSRFVVTLGLGENRYDDVYTAEAFSIHPQSDHSIFITFSKKIGGLR